MEVIKKNSMLLMIIMLVFHVSVIYGEADTEVRAKIKPWTFLVYMAADNDLVSFIELSQRGMEKVGTNDFINILMFVSTHLPDQPKVSKKYVVYKNNSTLLGTIENVDSGSENTVVDACQWALQSFPSEHFALIFWGHGYAWRKEKGVCRDDTTGNKLTDETMAQALKTIYHYCNNKKIDIVGFDACLMANIETAFAIAPYAMYMVASEETIYEDGWNYARLLEPLEKGTLSPESFARAMVVAYDTYYKNPAILTEDYTLSAIDLTKILPLAHNVNEVALAFNNLLTSTSKTNILEVIGLGRERKNCVFFSDPTMLDLYCFYDNVQNLLGASGLTVTNKTALQLLLTKGMNLFNQCIVSHAEGSAFKGAQGLSIYFPQNSYEVDYNATLFSAAVKQWPLFLQHYITA